ncbi:hypothetical protein N1031_00555 [Herbiconiux moechotypicola]|uniref:Uncharacterized protein n=1 Tax=Herbiconiux moechotypicola TaxID=637393 RepID=A0ABP5Q3Q0_9MICO|nr:hypothetical protein [Herbiconiux moechotypicola]MCS5728241.1 hypothetical protein [Herbiconiux moechotypicola]
MTSGRERRAARPRPPLTTALLALPAGGLATALLAIAFAIVVYGSDAVLDPASEGGTGSAGLVLYAAFWAMVLGSLIGVGLGMAVAIVAVVSWGLRAPRWVVASACGVVVTVLAFVLVPESLTHAQSFTLAALGSAHGIAGAILLAWAGEARAGARLRQL